MFFCKKCVFLIFLHLLCKCNGKMHIKFRKNQKFDICDIYFRFFKNQVRYTAILFVGNIMNFIEIFKNVCYNIFNI